MPHCVSPVTSCRKLLVPRGAGDPASTAVQGQLVSEMRYLASVVTQCFTAFGELLGMQKRFAELSGGVTRVSELGGTLRAAAAQEATIRTIAAADDITRVLPGFVPMLGLSRSLDASM